MFEWMWSTISFGVPMGLIGLGFAAGLLLAHEVKLYKFIANASILTILVSIFWLPAIVICGGFLCARLLQHLGIRVPDWSCGPPDILGFCSALRPNFGEKFNNYLSAVLFKKMVPPASEPVVEEKSSDKEPDHVDAGPYVRHPKTNELVGCVVALKRKADGMVSLGWSAYNAKLERIGFDKQFARLVASCRAEKYWTDEDEFQKVAEEERKQYEEPETTSINIQGIRNADHRFTIAIQRMIRRAIRYFKIKSSDKDLLLLSRDAADGPTNIWYGEDVDGVLSKWYTAPPIYDTPKKEEPAAV